LIRELTVVIDNELEKEMSKYPEVDWAKVVRKAIKEYIHLREIYEMNNAPIERAMSQSNSLKQ